MSSGVGVAFALVLSIDGVADLETAITARPWLVVTLVMVGSYLLARFVHWASRQHLARSGEDEISSVRRTILEEITVPLALSIALVGLYVSIAVLELEFLEERIPLLEVIQTVLIVLWVRVAIRSGSHWIEHLKASDLTYEFAPIFKNLWTISAVLIGALLLLSIWNLEVTPFLASAGVIGIVVGFAAQEAIANLIGGTALYFDNTYKIGDVIRVEDDMRGTVTDIGIRSTTVLTPDNRVVSVPNAVLNSNQVVNETAPQRHVRIDIPISAAYGTDYETVEEIALEVCTDSPIVRDRPRPRVLFRQFGDSALVFELQAYISHPLTERRAVDQINRKIYDRFADADITIPFPQRELSFLEDDGEEYGFDEQAVPADTNDTTGDSSDTTVER